MKRLVIKRMLIVLPVLAAVFALAAAVATAASVPKASGDYGYSFNSVQRHLTFNATTSTTDTCGTFWNVTGTKLFSEMQPGDPLVYTHDAVLQQNGQSVTGSGGWPTGVSPYTYAWHVTSGSVVGNALTLNIQYDTGPGSIGQAHHMTGTIAADGSVSGIWNDAAFGTPRTGTFTMPAGTAAGTDYCGKGTALYTDENGSWYFMSIKSVSISGSTAWYAAQIIASSPDLGFENSTTNFLFVRVIDNFEPGVGHDITGGDLKTESDARAAVVAQSIPHDNATINLGNIQVH